MIQERNRVRRRRALDCQGRHLARARRATMCRHPFVKKGRGDGSVGALRSSAQGWITLHGPDRHR